MAESLMATSEWATAQEKGLSWQDSSA